MARKDIELVPFSKGQKDEYSSDRSHLFAMVASDIASMRIIKNDLTGVYFVERFGDVLSANGWSYFDHINCHYVNHHDLTSLIDDGFLEGFIEGERQLIQHGVMINLQNGPLPF